MTDISVIVPSYRHGQYLADAIASVIGGETSIGSHEGQSVDLEIVIVDDASDDGSDQIAERIARSSDQIRCIKLFKNGGTPRALNAGIRAARGRLIQVLAADDMLEPRALERLSAAIADDPSRYVYGDITVFGHGKRGRLIRLAEFDCQKILGRNPVPACIMYQRRAWLEAGGYPEEMSSGWEDRGFALALLEAGRCGRRVDVPAYLYRREDQRRSDRRNKKEIMPPDGGDSWLEFLTNQLRELFPELTRDLEGGDLMGGNSMGCCGGGRRTAAARGAKRAEAAPFIPGARGMVPVKYIGPSHAFQTFWGAETKTAYVFGGKRVRGNVDVVDLPGMLAMSGKGGHPLFVRLKK